MDSDDALAGEIEVLPVTAISGDPVLPSLGRRRLAARSDVVLEVSAAPTEYEPVSFVLRSTQRTIHDVRLVGSDLVNEATHSVIPADQIDIRIVKVWFQGASAWNDIGRDSPGDFRQRLVPELLLKDDSLVQVDIKSERNYLKVKGKEGAQYIWVNRPELAPADQGMPATAEPAVEDGEALQPFDLPVEWPKQIWVTFHVPRDAPAGTYLGHIDAAGEGAEVRVGLQLRVHPFELQDSGLTYSIYYRAQLSAGGATVGSEFKSEAQMRLELADLAQHGVVSPGLYQVPGNAQLLASAMRLRELAHANVGPLFYLGIQTTADSLGGNEGESTRVLRQIVPSITRLARRYGYQGAYIYGRDEATGKALASQRPLWRAVHESGAGVFVAGGGDAYPLMGDLLDVLVYYGKPDAQEARKWHSAGRRILSYANPQSGPENPVLFRLNYGLVLWASGFDGAMPYAYQHCFGSCWNDLDHPVYRDHALTYPTMSGPIPTLAWEGYREAIDDVRYIRTLERFIGNPRPGRQSQAAAATQYLNRLRQDVLAAQAKSGKYNKELPLDLDAVRRTIAAHIVALSSADFVG